MTPTTPPLRKGRSSLGRQVKEGFSSLGSRIGRIGYESSQRGQLPLASAGIMKKTTTRQKRNDELRPEYDFSAMVSRPNPFATRMTDPVVAVVLEPDVAQVFGTADDVNRMLRSVISGLPQQTTHVQPKPRRKAG